jgi:hypothetical protein
VPSGAGAGEQVRVQRTGERVGGEDLQPSVLHECRDVGHRVEQPLHARTDALPGGTTARAGRGAGAAGQVEEVRALGLVELQCAGSTEPPLRWAAGADAVGALEQKARDLLAQADAHRELSSSLAHADA